MGRYKRRGAVLGYFNVAKRMANSLRPSNVAVLGALGVLVPGFLPAAVAESQGVRLGLMRERQHRRGMSALRAGPPQPLGSQPQLDPWHDVQPLDTSLGNFFVSGFVEGPTPTPPPSQGSMDIAAACPVISEWPETVEIDAPNPCGAQLGFRQGGFWQIPSGSTAAAANVYSSTSSLLRWDLSCGLQGLMPAVQYTMPNGDPFGMSHTVVTFTGTRAQLSDCEGNARYYVDEKVYREASKADPITCKKYGSCDGTIWLQYFVYDRKLQIVAQTPYLHLFEDSFEISDPRGNVIAKAEKRGGWSPFANDNECNIVDMGADGPVPRKWALTFIADDGKSDKLGVFANPTDQWPIAELVTMMAVRDAHRQPSGLVAPSACEVRKSTLFLLVAFMLTAIVCSGIAIFFRFGLQRCRTNLFDLELRICPSQMRKPSKYEGV